MPGDGILSIGATVDKTGVDEGLSSIQEGVQATVQSIAVQVEETCAKTKAAWNKLSADVKTAATSVSAESLKVAEATKAQAAALADLRRASVLSKDAKLDEATSTAILAAAQQKAAAASAEVAKAKQEEAAAVAEANEKEGLSENFLVARFQLAGREISESLSSVRERLVLTSETANLSARDMAAGFSGLGELLGIGLLAGIGGDYLDELAKMNVELDHLHVESGISITSLAGLQQIVKEMGGEWDPIALGLVRVNRAMAEAQEGMAEYKRAFADIGVTMEELKGKTPEQKLGILATAFAKTANEERVADAAITLFGRGGLALIPVLKEQGSQLEANMAKTGELTGITDDSAAAARRWTADMANLTRVFRSVMMPVMEHAGDVVRGIATLFEGAAAAIISAFEGIGTAILANIAMLGSLAKALNDAMHFNYSGAIQDAKEAGQKFEDVWKDGFTHIKAAWSEVYHTFSDHPQAPALPQGFDPGDLTPPEKKPKGGASAALRQDEEDLDQLKLDHEVTLAEEIAFWQKRLETAKKGSAEYRAILAKLASLEQRQDKQKPTPAPLPPQTQSYDTSASEAAMIASLQEQVKATQNATAEELQAYRDAAEEKIRLAQEDFQDLERDTEQEVQMGRMSAQERTAALLQAANRQKQIVEQLSQYIEMLDMRDTKRHSADLQKEEQQTRQWARKIEQINQQASMQFQKEWQQAFNKFTNEFASAVSSWVMTGKGFEQSMYKIMNGIAENFIQNLVKMMAQEMLAAITHKSLMSQKIMADAKAAAADAFQWASGWGGPIAGAVAAAAAFAGVMAFDSFAEGGVVRGGGGGAVPVLAHAGERVLSQAQTANFERLVNNNVSSNRSSATTHLHYEPKVDGSNTAAMRRQLQSHAADILDIVRSGYRSGALSAS